MATRSRGLVLDTGKLNRLLRDRSGDVGRTMAGFAGLATTATKQVARERVRSRTGRYIDSIKSTTVGTPQGVKVVTESITYGGAPEKATRPHPISSKTGKTLRFKVGGMVVWVPPSRQPVHHPGTAAKNVLRDGVRRAGHQLGRIAR